MVLHEFFATSLAKFSQIYFRNQKYTFFSYIFIEIIRVIVIPSI